MRETKAKAEEKLKEMGNSKLIAKEKSFISKSISQSGITLVALVITIIVLLILAGVSIATLTGDNGILTQANNAKERTEQAEKDEKTNLAQTEDFINEYVNGVEVEQVTDENPGTLETEGTDTYVINSIEDLVFFAYDVREGNTYEGQTVKLGLSLDFNSSKSYVDPFMTDYAEYGYDGELKTSLTSGEGFKAIGTERHSEAEVKKVNIFKGIFDGDNNVIYGLYIDRDITYDGEEYEEYKIGLFGYNGGTIKNLGLANNNVKVEKISGNCNVFAGGIVGQNQGTIENCYNQGNISNSFIVGGISGRNNGTITSCYNLGNISGSAGSVGGISGDSIGGNFSFCYNKGTLKGNGAIAGISTSANSINSCYNNGKIISESTNEAFVSGIGVATVGVTNCYNTGEIDVKNNNIVYVSGITATYQSCTIKNCYNTGKISMDSKENETNDQRIAGIASIGNNIENCYNLGEIKVITNSTFMSIGGVEATGNNGGLKNSYNSGKIEINSEINLERVGAILGDNEYGGNPATLSNCIWKKGTYSKGIGKGDGDTLEVEEKDMPSVLSIINSENCFKEDTNNINNGYPILNWQRDQTMDN